MSKKLVRVAGTKLDCEKKISYETIRNNKGLGEFIKEVKK